jgi:Mg-chelatase subunit ChlD
MYALLAQFELQHPQRLCWLAVLLPVLFFALRSTTEMATWQRIATTLCRVLAISLLVIAYADLVQRSLSEQKFVIFATDASRSVSGTSRQAADEFLRAALKHQGDNRVAFLDFASEPGDVRSEPDGQSQGLNDLASNPAAALQLAAASIPGDFVPQVVLLTDGNQTAGDLGRAAATAAIPISVVPLAAFADPEVAITDLRAPIRAESGSRIPLEVVAQSNRETTGTLELHSGGEVLASTDVELQTGENHLTLDMPLGSQREAILTAKLSASQDTHPENNARRTGVSTIRPRRVLLVDSVAREAESFLKVLTREGVEATLQSLQEFQAASEPLDTYDLLILSDVAPAEMQLEKLQAIERFVGEQGGGLLLLGGDETFGVPAFRGTALEKMAPVTAADTVETDKKSVLAMVLVIDRSESMKVDRRMELAKVAAKQSIQVLESHDKAGVIAFSDEVEWIAEIEPCDNKADLLARIDTLTHQGMTRMYPAVERAVLALQQTVADRRHMILLTDGIPWPGNYREIAREMAESGITLSTVSISPGAEQDLLIDMARIAGGRHHHCDNAADVPGILVRETRAAAGQEKPAEFSPFALRKLPGLETDSAPNLLGYARTNPKDQAEPLLFAVAGHPLLSWWRYGAGITVAFTADVKDRWSTPWHSWSGYGPFWKRLVRHAARRSTGPDLNVSVKVSGRQATISVDAPLDAESGRPSDSRVMAEVSSPNCADRVLDLTLVAPGLYQASFETAGDDEFEIDVTFEGPSGQLWHARSALLIDYPEELQWRPTRESLLRGVAAASGGDYDPDPARVFEADGRTVERITAYWQYFVLAAMLLLVVDVALRRLRR